jgi:hypothetical protein
VARKRLHAPRAQLVLGRARVHTRRADARRRDRRRRRRYGDLGGEPAQLLLLPGVAPELRRAGIAYGFDGSLVLAPGRAMLALLVTIGWFAVPMAAALFLFARQDLARE